MNVTYHTVDTAPEAARATLEEANKAYGMIPNLFKQMSDAPALVRAYWQVAKAFSESSLSPQEQQVVLIAASVKNSCTYCVGAHSTIADMVQLPTEITDALRDSEPVSDSRLQTLRTFAEKVVDKRGWVDPGDVDAFLAGGFEQPQVLEVILGVGLKTLSNYTHHIVGTELDEPFQGRAWKPSC